MIDLSKTVWILAVVQEGRLGVLGGTNDEDEARVALSVFPGAALLRAEPVEDAGG
jgi:hypothetical protein